MFANIIRCDWYRLVRSRFLQITVIVFAVVIGLFALFCTSGNSRFSFGGPTGNTKDGVPLIDGFVGFAYVDAAHPHFWEIMYSATCFTIITLFAIPITGMIITSTDDLNGTTKLAVARGNSQTLMFVSKVILAVLVTGVLWVLHNLVTLLITLSQMDFSLTGEQWYAWAKFIGLSYLVQLVLMLLASWLVLLTRSRVVGFAVLVVLTFGTIIVAAVNRELDSQVINTLLAIDPVWHLNRIGRAWAETQITGQALLFCCVAIPVLMAASIIRLRSRELS